MNTTERKSVITAWLPHCVCSITYPWGVCIQELAIRIHSALKWAPKTTRKVARSHSRGPRRLPPKSISPRKPPSRKKAKMPSAARRAPKTLPTKRE